MCTFGFHKRSTQTCIRFTETDDKTSSVEITIESNVYGSCTASFYYDSLLILKKTILSSRVIQYSLAELSSLSHLTVDNYVRQKRHRVDVVERKFDNRCDVMRQNHNNKVNLRQKRTIGGKTAKTFESFFISKVMDRNVRRANMANGRAGIPLTLNLCVVQTCARMKVLKAVGDDITDIDQFLDQVDCMRYEVPMVSRYMRHARCIVLPAYQPD